MEQMFQNMDLNHINRFFNSKKENGSLEVNRDGARIKVEFRLQNQI